MESYDDSIETGLTKRSDQLLREIGKIINSIEIDHNPTTIVKIGKLIGEFETLPNLLDPKLAEFIDILSYKYLENIHKDYDTKQVTRAIASIVYNLSKIRGFKIITNFFDSNINLIHKIIKILHANINEDEIFMNLIWLSNLVLVPFKFNNVMTTEIFNIGLCNLKKFSNGSKNQQVSSILLSRLLSRPDVNDTFASYFEKLTWYDMNNDEKLGHLMVINKLLKIRHMDNYIDKIYDYIQFEVIQLRIKSISTINLLYIIKLLCKLGEKYAMIDNFHKLENILNNLINNILLYYNDSFETTLRYAMAKSLSRLTNKLLDISNYQEQIILYLMNKLELNLDESGFKDIEINYDLISIPKYHTILLYLGYISLNKSLPHYLIPSIFSIVHKTLFTHLQYNLNVSNQLKDSSCFIIWSIVRMVGKKFDELNQHLMFNIILKDLIEVSIFDKDLIIRRCAVAVIQELIGRFGQSIVIGDFESKGKKIIEFVEIFTSTSVSTLNESFGNLNKLLDKGFNKGLIVKMLMNNLHQDFNYQKMVTKKLNQVLKLDSSNELNIGIDSEISSIDSILQTFTKLDHSLYFKSELRLNYEFEIEEVAFNEEYIEDHIKFLETCCRLKNFQAYELLFTQVIQSRKEISQPLIELFETMTINDYYFPHSSFKTLSRYLSISIAKSIFYSNLTKEQRNALLELVNSNLHYEIRYNLIDSLHANFNRIGKQLDLKILTSSLDDYTITEQGDVGSKIRNSTLDFIDEFLHEFLISDDYITDDGLTGSLSRIAGEPLGKLRIKAFSILLRIKNIDLQLENINDGQYYRQLFSLYDVFNDNERQEFWIGIVSSIGGLTGDSSNISQSFREFIRLLESRHHDEQIFKHILKLVTKTPNESAKISKQYIQGLNLIIKLFEVSTPFPRQYLMPLYVKCYNLQINTHNLQRVKLTVKIMQYLAMQYEDKVSLTSIKRILTLFTNHKSMVIRNFALECIYEIILDDTMINEPIVRKLEMLDMHDKSTVDQIKQYILNKFS